VRVENGRVSDWLLVEDDLNEEYLNSYAPHGLKLHKVISSSPTLHLMFTPVDSLDGSALYAQCSRDHPFFVKEKGDSHLLIPKITLL